MAVQREDVLTLDQFTQFIQLPENSEKLFEFINGEIIEVPSNPFVSKIAGLILTFINLYLFKNDIGHVTGEAGGYIVNGELYAPDVAFIAYAKQPQLVKEGYNPTPPDLAVEVISSDSKAENDRLTLKLGHYLAAGTMVWIVRPEAKYIEVHTPGQPPRKVQGDEAVEGGAVLPGFRLKVSDVLK